ncbi:MAG: class II aldolase/adducin family protein [Beijerinckiaceae bacterium]|nr:class II aldolase/adducin family protein [Beijerinckiaceae bacterium]MBX9760096.1 class II aldolase/adducin family protein [Beijerinckiaceae bacterium]
MTPHEAKQRLVDAGRLLEAHGQADFTNGHVSVRVPGRQDIFFMKPHSIGFGEITLDNILTVDLDGTVVEGAGRRHSEVFIHTEIYRARPDLLSVMHSHPPHAVALSCTGETLAPISQPAAIFFEALPLYDGEIDLIRTPEMGRGVAAALGPHRAVLMRNHGIAVGGVSVEETTVTALMLEQAAMIQMLAMSSGRAAPMFAPEKVRALQKNLSRPDQHVVNFNYLLRNLRA